MNKVQEAVISLGEMPDNPLFKWLHYMFAFVVVILISEFQVKAVLIIIWIFILASRDFTSDVQKLKPKNKGRKH